MQKLIFMLCFVPRELHAEVEVSEEVFRAAFNIPDAHFSPNESFANGIVQGRVGVAETPDPEIEWFEDSPNTIAYLYNERVITDMNIIFIDPDGERALFAGSDDKGNNYLLMSLGQRIGILKLAPKEKRRSNLTELYARFQVEKSFPIPHSFLSRKHFLNENERINFVNSEQIPKFQTPGLMVGDIVLQQTRNGPICGKVISLEANEIKIGPVDIQNQYHILSLCPGVEFIENIFSTQSSNLFLVKRKSKHV